MIVDVCFCLEFRGFQHVFMKFHVQVEFTRRQDDNHFDHLAPLRWFSPSSGLTQLPGFDLLKEYYDR